MKLLIIKFSPLSCYLVPLMPKYSSQHLISKHLTNTSYRIIYLVVHTVISYLEQQTSELYPNSTLGLLNRNEIFCSDANSLTPEHIVQYQHMLGFVKFTIKM
jgi:hypothetical protein